MQDILVQKQKVVTGKGEALDLTYRVIDPSQLGSPAEIEDLERAPPPKPIIAPLDIDTPPQPQATPPGPEEKPAPPETPEPPPVERTPERATPEQAGAGAAAGAANRTAAAAGAGTAGGTAAAGASGGRGAPETAAGTGTTLRVGPPALMRSADAVGVEDEAAAALRAAAALHAGPAATAAISAAAGSQTAFPQPAIAQPGSAQPASAQPASAQQAPAQPAPAQPGAAQQAPAEAAPPAAPPAQPAPAPAQAQPAPGKAAPGKAAPEQPAPAPPPAPAAPAPAPPAGQPAPAESGAAQAPPGEPGAEGQAAAVPPPEPEKGWVLTLEQVLRATLANHRDYQTRKESVYLTALALTLVRWEFAPRFFGLISGQYVWDGNETESGSIATDLGWNQVLASGARLSISAANNFLRFFLGERRELANTIISGNLTQPLLRGFGPWIVLEPLTQAERNVIYEIRAFERFRQSLVVDVASDYYRVLQARNRIGNEYVNWQGLVNNLDRAQALAEAEKLPKFEVDQVRQRELEARNRYVVAVEDYQTLLDQFKITLHFPIETPIKLDEKELTKLETAAGESLEIRTEDAVTTALGRRLDLLNVRDQAEDSRRRVRVAADALRAQLDVNLQASLVSRSDVIHNQPLKLDASTGLYSVGFDLDLPFDRRAERNTYVTSLIRREQDQREADLFEDRVRVNVREAHRRLLREKETLKIQEISVRLAEARVESTGLLRDAGRAETRDLLDAQAALVEAKNALTAALINLAIARLEFFRDTGSLQVAVDGRWIEEPIPRQGT